MAQNTPLQNNLWLTLLRAEPKDAEKVLAYLNQVAGESENITFGPGELGLSVEEERVFLRQTTESPTSFYVIAEIAGKIAGTLSFSAGTSSYKSLRARSISFFNPSIFSTIFHHLPQ